MWFSAVYEPQLCLSLRKWSRSCNWIHRKSQLCAASTVDTVATVHEPKFDVTTIMNLSHGRGRQIIFTRFNQSNGTNYVRLNMTVDLNQNWTLLLCKYAVIITLFWVHFQKLNTFNDWSQLTNFGQKLFTSIDISAQSKSIIAITEIV